MTYENQLEQMYKDELLRIYETNEVDNVFLDRSTNQIISHDHMVNFSVSDDGYLWAYNTHGDPLSKREVLKIYEYLNYTSNSEYNEVNSRIEFLKNEISGLQEKRSSPTEVIIKKPKNGYVYLLEGENHRYKIGASKNPKDRLKQLKISSCENHKLKHTIKSNDMFLLEKELHLKFSDKRVHSEWFELSENDVNIIKGMI